MSTLATLVVKLIGDASGFGSSIEGAADTVRRAGASIGAVGSNLTTHMTLPLVGMGVAAVAMGNQFNAGMANVVSLVPEAAGEIAGMSDDVQQLAVDMGQATGDMTAGLYQQISATGYSAESLDMLRVNAMAAAAGLSSTKEAIDLTSAVTKGYGDTTIEATQKVADLALRTVQLGQTTFPELAASMGRVVPIAANLGVAQEELFAVMATATGVTGGAAEVSTQLRGALQSLMAPTETMGGLIESMGFKSGQAMIEQLGLQGSIQAIVDAANASGTPLQAYMGSIEGQTLALALAGPQADTYKEKLTAMGSAAGTAQTAFDLQTQGVNAAGFAMQQATISLQTMAQDLGNALAPAVLAIMPFVQQFVGFIQDLVNRFTALDPQTQAIILGVVGLAAALGPVLMVVGSIVSGIGAVIGVLGALVGPIGIVIALAVALFAAWQTNFLGIRDIVGSVMTEIQGIIENVVNLVRGIIQGVMQLMQGDVQGGMNTIRTAFEDAWNNITTLISQALSNLISYVQQHLPEWITQLGEWANRLWQWIQEAAPIALQRLGEMIAGLLQYLVQQLPGWIAKLLDWAAAATRWLADAIPDLIVKAGQFLGALISWLVGTAVPGLIRETPKLVGALIDWIANDLIPMVGPALGRFLEEVVNFIVGMVEAVAQAAWSIGEGIVNGIRQGISDLWDSFRDWIGGLITAVIDWLKGLMGIKSPSRVMADEIGRPMIEGILAGAQEAAPGVTSGLAGIVTNMVSAMTAAAGGLAALGGASNTGGLISGLIQFVSSLVRAFHEATAWISTAAINVKAQSDAFNAAAQEMLETLLDAIELLASMADLEVPPDGAAIVRPLIDFVSDLVLYMHTQISWITAAVINVKAQSDAFNAAAQEMIETLGMGIELIRNLEDFDPPVNVVTQIQALIRIVSDLARIMASELVAAGMNVVVAARVFAETIQPVVGLIDQAVTSLHNMENLPPIDVDRVFRMIRQTLIDMVRILRDVQAYVGHLADAAAVFATRLLPAIKPVTDAMELLLKMGDWEPVDVDRIFHSIRQVLVDMVWTLRQAASYVDSIVVEAAAFATRLAPAMAPVIAAMDLLVKMKGWEPVDVDRVFHSIRQVLVDMVRTLQQADEYVGWAIPQAIGFAERIAALIVTVNTVIDLLARLAEVDVPAAAAVIAKVWEEVQAIIVLIRNSLLLELGKFDPVSMMRGAFEMGADWLRSLVAGIWSAMPDLESALAYIAGLFPHSPAEYGPLRQGPNWAGYMMDGLDQAGNMLARRLSAAMPGGAVVPVGAGASGPPATRTRGGNSVTININNPRGEPSEKSLRRELTLMSQLGIVEL